MPIAFHGTSTAFLDSILRHGLLPNPPHRSWAEDPDASVYSQSRVSLPGVYFARNLLTATGAALRTTKRFGGRELVVIVDFDLRDAIPDEDTIRSRINRIVAQYLRDLAVGFMLHLDYYTDVLGYIDALEAFAEMDGPIAAAARRIHDAFFRNFAAIANQQFGLDPNDTTHSDLWAELLRVHILRRTSYQWEKAHAWTEWGGEFRWRPESYFDYQRHYGDGAKAAGYSIAENLRNQPSPDYNADPSAWSQWYERVSELGHEATALADEMAHTVYEIDMRPAPSPRAEEAYLALLDRVARAYPHWAQAEIEEGALRSFRLLTPVGYTGSPRIVAIAELPRLGDREPLRLHYGTLPNDFIEQYTQKIGGNFNVQVTTPLAVAP